MNGVFMFLALGERPGGKLKQTAFFLVSTERLLFDFAKTVDHSRGDQPDDAVFEWTEPAEVPARSHPERTLSRRHCLTPGAVLPGLKWLQNRAPSDDRLKRDILGLIAFCEHAHARGDYVVAVRVP